MPSEKILDLLRKAFAEADKADAQLIAESERRFWSAYNSEEINTFHKEKRDHTINHHLTGIARSVAQLLGFDAEAFARRILAYSELGAHQLAAAASGRVELSADLSEVAGGSIGLSLEWSGRGELHSRFERPDAVSVLLYDTEWRAVVPLKQTNEWAKYLRVPAGRRRTEIAVDLEGVKELTNLYLVVFT